MKNILLLLLLVSVNPLFAQEVVKEELSFSVKEAVKILEKDLKKRGFTIFAKIDHAKAAKKAGLTMNPAVLVVFGNPAVGTELMNSNIAWSYELPMKIAVYEDTEGKTWAQIRLLPQDVPAPNLDKKIASINTLLAQLVKIKK